MLLRGKNAEAALDRSKRAKLARQKARARELVDFVSAVAIPDPPSLRSTVMAFTKLVPQSIQPFCDVNALMYSKADVALVAACGPSDLAAPSSDCDLPGDSSEHLP